MILSIDYLLIKSLKQSLRKIGDNARKRITDFIISQMTEQHTFVNRSGKPDLYYTMFGWTLCYVLGIPTNKDKRQAYLDAMGNEPLDELHRIVHDQCILINELINKGFVRASLSNIKNWHHTKDFLKMFNLHTVTKSINGYASELFIENRGMFAKGKKEKIQYILSMQDETGGFYANESAQIPDMLSTAVSLFTLRAFGINPKYDSRNFIDVHFREDGSFMPTLLDRQSDVEYVFYGLLAIANA